MSDKIRILYIDDYDLDRELVKDALEKEHGGFQITEASDKQEFEALLKTREFDVVLSDFNIAGFEGLQVLEAVRAHDSSIPVIIVTGTGSEEIAVKALKQGASDYVIKRPKHILRLPQTILAAIEKQALRNQRQEAELFLKESEKRYRSLFEMMMNGYCYCRMLFDRNKPKDFIYIDVNKAFETLIGLKNVAGKKVSEVIPGIQETDPELFEICGRVALTGIPEIFEMYIEALSMWFSISVYRPEKEYFVAIFDVITERKQTEEKLRKALLRQNEAVKAANVGLWDRDLVTNKVKYSAEWKRHIGYEEHEISDNFEEWESRVHPEDLKSTLQKVQHSIAEAQQCHQIEFRLRHKDGSYRWILTQASVIQDESGRAIKMIGSHIDITERKKMEEELLRVQKLESLGLLAGGIAHDFNNILTTILGNVSLAKNQVTPEDEIFDLLNEAELASTRAQTLTRQLLTFAKGGAPVKETASIKNILKESCSFVLRGSKSRSEFSIAEDLWPAEVDIGQISQVINNIVINANQAMPEGGIIRVAAENLIIDDGQSLPLKSGRYIRISIKDQGVGIAEKHLLNIFDPYFTTKNAGSGLGLATTYSIIKRHDGHITVESQLGHGTTLHIYLHASEKAVPEKKEVKLIKGQGRILVMDDVAALRKIAGRILEKLGYEPEFAKNGAEAIRMYKEAQASEKPYHAVILDLTIPGGMGGKDAVNKLLEIDPEVKAIVSSGYSDDPVLSNFQEYGFKGMMPKPFTSQSLSKVLHEVLQGEKE